MSSSASALLAPLAVCLLLGAVPDRDDGKSPTTWGAVTDPDGDCKIQQDGDRVTITVPKTHHDLTYNDQYTKLNAPRILRQVHGDFEAVVQVPAIPLPGKKTSSSGAHSFVSCGLLVWQDAKNFLRVERAAEGNGGGEFVWVERFAGGRPVEQKLQRVANKDLLLRVERRGDRFTCSFRQPADGEQWTEVHSGEAKLPRDVQAGVHAINTTTREFAPRFQGLQIRDSSK